MPISAACSLLVMVAQTVCQSLPPGFVRVTELRNQRQDVGQPSAQLDDNRWPIPPPVPPPLPPPYYRKSSSSKDDIDPVDAPPPTQSPVEVPTFVPRTLPTNQPLLLPVHYNEPKQDEEPPVPPLPPGYDDSFVPPAPNADPALLLDKSSMARDQPRVPASAVVGNPSSGRVSPTEIRNGPALALYALGEHYAQRSADRR